MVSEVERPFPLTLKEIGVVRFAVDSLLGKTTFKEDGAEVRLNLESVFDKTTKFLNAIQEEYSRSRPSAR